MVLAFNSTGFLKNWFFWSGGGVGDLFDKSQGEILEQNFLIPYIDS
jgi:hypothetical protein